MRAPKLPLLASLIASLHSTIFFADAATAAAVEPDVLVSDVHSWVDIDVAGHPPRDPSKSANYGGDIISSHQQSKQQFEEEEEYHVEASTESAIHGPLTVGQHEQKLLVVASAATTTASSTPTPLRRKIQANTNNVKSDAQQDLRMLRNVLIFLIGIVLLLIPLAGLYFTFYHKNTPGGYSEDDMFYDPEEVKSLREAKMNEIEMQTRERGGRGGIGRGGGRGRGGRRGPSSRDGGRGGPAGRGVGGRGRGRPVAANAQPNRPAGRTPQQNRPSGRTPQQNRPARGEPTAGRGQPNRQQSGRSQQNRPAGRSQAIRPTGRGPPSRQQTGRGQPSQQKENTQNKFAETTFL
jgi:hypothetical protein